MKLLYMTSKKSNNTAVYKEENKTHLKISHPELTIIILLVTTIFNIFLWWSIYKFLQNWDYTIPAYWQPAFLI